MWSLYVGHSGKVGNYWLSQTGHSGKQVMQFSCYAGGGLDVWWKQQVCIFLPHCYGIFRACNLITGTIASFVTVLVKCSTAVHPLSSLLLSSSPLPFSWNPAFVFYCGVAYPVNPAPLQPWGGDSFPPAPLLSPRSGGLSRLIYNAARVDQIFTLTQCA